MEPRRDTNPGSSGEDQDGRQAGPLEWSIRGTEDRSSRLEHLRKKAPGPALDRLGLNKKEKRKAAIYN